MNTHATIIEDARGYLIKGIVQGVGFRPTLKRWAIAHALVGYTRNTPEGLEVAVWGQPSNLDAFEAALRQRPPALSRIDQIITFTLNTAKPHTFDTQESTLADSHTLAISPDVGMCEDCLAEIFDPLANRFRYPFTNCTNCGPRFTIIRDMPYDRARTSMSEFTMCTACESEYNDTDDRRCHAQPIACYHCGPIAHLRRLDGHVVCIDSFTQTDELDAVCSLIKAGAIVAIKGIGGFHLACDATNQETVAQLRSRKRRPDKPLALMARDEQVIRRYAKLSTVEAELLQAKEAPIVLLDALPVSAGGQVLADNVAPQQNVLGFMLPYTPLHALIMRRMDRPIVMTSGNVSDEPQCVHAQDVDARLSDIAEYIVDHNRPIERRIDDSVVRVVDEIPRVVRRARGYAPANLPLPQGFGTPPSILTLGGDLKNTFCLLDSTGAVLSHHIGELSNPFIHDDYVKAIEDLTRLFTFTPDYLVADAHPDYYSNKHAKILAESNEATLIEAQHHHAHVASCLFENGRALTAPPVLGIVLDGLGYWDGALCGGEFVRADYTQCTRLGTFKPVALPGREKAMVEPWRNTAAHLLAETSLSALQMNFEALELIDFLTERSEIQAILDSPHAPLASSAGRLFDAVAAAVGICRETISFEGQAAIALEAIVDQEVLQNENPLLAYPFSIPNLPDTGMPYIEPLAMWQALLGDLILKTPPATIAARFHKGLAQIIVQMTTTLAEKKFETPPTIALSGGVWQNKTLTQRVSAALRDQGFTVLQHAQVPTNDGGLALGQAAIGAAALLKHGSPTVNGETTVCA